MKSTNAFRTLSAALALTLSASAATVSFDLGGVVCPAGACTAVAGTHEINFDSASAPSPFTSGIASFSFSPGGVSPFVTGSLSGEYAAPPSDETRYLSVGSPNRANTVTIDFSSAIDYYGLYLGSPDAYNVFTFYGVGNNDLIIGSFTGNELIPPGQGNQSIGAYVNFRAQGGAIGRIVLSSNQAALESDNHAYRLAGNDDPGQVPEPATMGLMGSALAGLAVWARRRR